ncbi:hypothetical protein LAZ67_15001849 [Cordylochernes scorpioides]|uniref:Integrase catalytic domain-containing protein n=1 Tax=Cordylochernes scorpioides TaxID=51811 RepID=A0ABY6L951_9ARAC|nr:hypothetical protein LAZ67_15001849 [Cordylochernes scorpioides]
MPGHRKRRQFKQTDAFTRGMVIGLKRAGWSIRQIAADTHLGASTVHRLWRRWLEQGNVAIYRNVGATRVTSARGTMTAQRYVDDVLRPVTLPYLQGVPNALYQQDNARPHTARISQQALQDVQMLPWPPYSPEHSPIEHVWDIIGRRLHALPQPRSEDELWQMVERERRAIPQDAIRTLIDSLPRRVAACIAVREKIIDSMLVSINRLIDGIKQKPLQSPAGKDAQAKTSSMPPRACSATPNSETDHQKVNKLQTTSTSLSKCLEESMKNEIEGVEKEDSVKTARATDVKPTLAKARMLKEACSGPSIIDIEYEGKNGAVNAIKEKKELNAAVEGGEGKETEAEVKCNKVKDSETAVDSYVGVKEAEAKGKAKEAEAKPDKVNYKDGDKGDEVKESKAEPKGEGVGYSEAEPKGEGVKYSEAEPKGEGVMYSEDEPKGEGIKYSEAEPKGEKESTEPKGEGAKYSEAEPKGEGVKYSEAEPKGEGVKYSEAEPKGEGIRYSEAEPKGDGVRYSEAEPKGEGIKYSEAEPKGEGVKYSEAEPKGEGVDYSEAEPKGEGIKYSEAGPKGEGVKCSEAEPKGEGVKYSEVEPKGEGVKYSEAEPKGEGVKYSEAESKGDGVKDSETAHKGNESVNNSEAKTKTNKVEDTVEEAQFLIRQIIALLAEGYFPIRKWVSNSPKMLDFLPGDQKGINQFFDFKDLPSVKLLDILWDPSLDSFTIRVRPPDIQVYSKRSLLSLIARIYDPLGWMYPLVIIFKIMLQKLWAMGCNWDERLPECIQWQLTVIEEDINQLNKISIPRYIPCRNSILTLELHGFCDSSEKAYAAVIYVKSYKHDRSVNISLIASKTTVAPIKVLSLPRLELCSALLLANLFFAVKESLSLHFDQIFLWSDSTIALNWIKSESKRWKTFVANRVSSIQRKTPPHSWFHVPGSENPADLATRGLTPAQLVDNQLWWQGPHWLQDPSVNSYIDLPPSDELSPETLIEERSTILVYHSIMGPMPELLLKYSFWIRTVDVMAFCLRFISNCKSTNKSLNRFLSASEVHNATVKVIILIQNQEFTQDIGWLRDKGFVSGKSNLRFLNPFLDVDGILRVGGRLQHSNLDYNRKHPIILPKRHHCTDLIIEHYHKQSLHSGLQTTLSMISQKYWIISCKAAVKKVLNQCITCFRHRSKVVTQIMAELPLERVVPTRPFQRVGVDLAGPIITRPMLKRSKILFKTYIVLFICFTTKAIHLEVVSDLTAEAFIATLRRFTSRRSLSSDIFSDNATNFKLANRVLLDFLQGVRYSKFLCSKRNWVAFYSSLRSPCWWTLGDRCLREAVRLKRPERWQNNDWILHVGNARPHTAHVVLQFLAKHSTIQIPHPPYSPDLAPNDFFLYPKLKMNLKGRKFDNVDMIQAESKATLRNLSKSDFISCFDNWKKRWNGCIEAGGAYFEKY